MDVLVGNTPQPAFRDLYPTPSAGRKNRADEVTTDGLENVFTNDLLVYCVHCGFPCRRDRDERRDLHDKAGKGVVFSEDTTVTRSYVDHTTGQTVTYHPYDLEVKGGCSFCGSFLYDQ